MSIEPKARGWREVWAIRAIAEYLKANAPPQMASTFVGMEEAMTSAFRTGDSRGMKMMVRDFEEWAKYLQVEHDQQLHAQLRATFGKGLREVVES